jgi:maleate isomerase
MTDRLGFRAKIGVLVPAFNATVQPEMEAMRPRGVTNHVARIDMPDLPLASDADQIAVVESLGADLAASIGRVIKVKPTALIFGISIPSFWGGVAAGAVLRAHVERLAGVPVAAADDACLTALRLLPKVRRIGAITPFQPVANDQVRRFFEEAGYEVTVLHSTRPVSNLEIAHVDDATIVTAFKAAAASGCDAVLQVGTNLASTDIADEAERWLGLPCLSINALLYWRALRLAGIADPIHGCGRLVAEH